MSLKLTSVLLPVKKISCQYCTNQAMNLLTYSAILLFPTFNFALATRPSFLVAIRHSIGRGFLTQLKTVLKKINEWIYGSPHKEKQYRSSF